MIKKIVIVANISTSLMAFSAANAAESCVKITGIKDQNGVVGTISQPLNHDCTAVWEYLRQGRFPSIFDANSDSPYANLSPGACYTSDPDDPILATLETPDGKQQQVTISSQSAITNEFSPVTFGGTDPIGSAITRFKITDADQKELATVDTADVIGFDLSLAPQGIIRSSELDIPVNGNKKLAGLTGSLKVEAELNLATPSSVTLTGVYGVLCVSSNTISIGVKLGPTF